MTPQTPQGALSDADILAIRKKHPAAIVLDGEALNFASDILAAADRRLTAEQPEEPIRMAYKTGYDEGYSDGSDGSVDHDACEEGWQQYRAGLTPVTAEQPVAWRLRYRSEPGMIGHYPWTYTERPRKIAHPSQEEQPLYARAPVTAEQGGAIVAPGFVLMQVKGFDDLMTALERADRKGYMPDAIADEWNAFDYRAALTTQPQAEPRKDGSISFEEAQDLARRHAKAEPESYYSEPFEPHLWVINAIVEASATWYERAVQERVRRVKADDMLWCETCEGGGTIDETLGGYAFSNPKADCPDCDGKGWWRRASLTTQPQAEPAAWIERSIYHKSEQYTEYLAARFPRDGLPRGNCFWWQGHNWRYRVTSFDDVDEFDVIERPSVATPTAPTEPT